MAKSYWLFKTEPETYSFANLLSDKKTHWNGVRNFQARNFLRQVAKSDLVVIYHSGDERAAVGIAEVTRDGYPDPDPKKPGDWVQVDIKPVQSMAQPVPLKEMKSTAGLAKMLLIKQSRLSVTPLTVAEYQKLLKMGGL